MNPALTRLRYDKTLGHPSAGDGTLGALSEWVTFIMYGAGSERWTRLVNELDVHSWYYSL